MWRSLRNLFHLIRLVLTLARHGALFLMERLPHAPALGVIARVAHALLRRREALKLREGERLSQALEALGPSFIKLGQSLATRSDLIGDDVADDLSRLQDRLPAFPAAIARATVEEELERPIEALYSSFEDTPAAAASIAQVHFAVTTEGEEVAVKILRPGIEKRFERDLDLLHWIAELAEQLLPWTRRLKPVEVVELFAETVTIEMDLRFEAAAAAELGENFVDDPNFHVPAIDWTRTSRRTMTIERIHGDRIDDLVALERSGHDVDQILTRSAWAFFQQVFRDGFFHADMHPGNIFVRADGSLAPVDFGIMGRLDKKTRDFLADMMTGFLTGNYRLAAEVHFRAGYVPAHKSVDQFTQACRSIGEPIFGKPMHEISLARLLAQLFKITEQFEMETQPQLLLLQKTMFVAEGVGRTLNPNVNMWELARPLIEEWMVDNRWPEARIRRAAIDAARAVERLPGLLEKTEAAIGELADGGLRLHRDTVTRMAEEQSRRRPGYWPLWVAALVVLAVLALD